MADFALDRIKPLTPWSAIAVNFINPEVGK